MYEQVISNMYNVTAKILFIIPHPDGLFMISQFCQANQSLSSIRRVQRALVGISPTGTERAYSVNRGIRPTRSQLDGLLCMYYVRRHPQQNIVNATLRHQKSF